LWKLLSRWGLSVCAVLSIPFLCLAGVFMDKDEDGTIRIKL
jgi:hypothetical protein